MMDESEREYCLQRADEERERAGLSEEEGIAARHAELARLYLLRADDPAGWTALSRQESA